MTRWLRRLLAPRHCWRVGRYVITAPTERDVLALAQMLREAGW